MFMTVFYGVIDPGQGWLCYANAGHPHAFRVGADGPAERLTATSPPLGIAEYDSYGETEVEWSSEQLLCLFTDGLTNPSLRTTERAIVAAVEERRDCAAEAVVDAMFEARARQSDPAPDDQTALILRV